MEVLELTDQQIAERLAALREPTGLTAGIPASPGDSAEGGGAEGVGHESLQQPAPLSISGDKRYRFVRPLIEAADSLIEYLQNTDGRYLLGLREVDLLTRGFGPGELVLVVGFSHSGKTQVALTSILNNPDKHLVIFTADEPAELVLTKLMCMKTRSNAERMEERVKANDAEAINRIRRYAREDFKNLIIVDQSMTRRDMSDAIKEAEDFWQAPIDCAFLDYLELFARAEGADVEEGSQQLKGWAMAHQFPTVVIHQGSRGHSGKGQALGMNAGKYGGEQEAIILIGVRRQRDNEALDDYERQRHENTVSVSVIKNKRPPSKRGEFDFYMCPDSGLVLPMEAQR